MIERRSGQKFKLDWSRRGWPRVFFWTIAGTLGCMAVALGVDYSNFITLDEAGRTRAILTNILVPVCLAAPLLFLLTNKIRQLAIAHEELTRLASTDSLTAVLNRGAFTMLVEAYLQSATRQGSAQGALLVVDADNFKAINDSYGHDRGDEALRLIAKAITGVLRGADIVGRIGGEEFGVFLPNCSPDHAISVAERIRVSVNVAEFRPANEERRELSVSVGGATFRRPVTFRDLFRIADQQLYEAKRAGRNRVSIAAPAIFSAAAA